VAHVTGESLFIDDMPPALGEVLVDFVGSPVANGRVRRIELEAARRALSGWDERVTHHEVTVDLQ
jgi:xanthine dehydrogenase molybdopterin-binding subunit B